MAVPLYGLGLPGKDTQSAYYPGPSILSKNELATVSRLMEQQNILLENTRIHKAKLPNGEDVIKILQASISSGIEKHISEGVQVILERETIKTNC